MTDAVADLEDRAADLRVVQPQGWETAVGTGVGISITTALVADPSSLSFNTSVSIPADAEAGDPIIIYMAIPTGSNLSDWRVNLRRVCLLHRTKLWRSGYVWQQYHLRLHNGGW